MSTPTPHGQESGAAPHAPSRPRTLRRVWLWAAMWLLFTAVFLGVSWFSRPRPPEPPWPADIQEADVRLAVEEARRPVLAAPRSAAAWGHLGKVLLGNLFDRDAVVCFAEASRLDPEEPLWPYAQGLVALKRDPDHALDLLRAAVARAGEGHEHLPVFRLQLAEALLEHNRLAEAETLFEQDVAADSQPGRAALGLGLIAVARDDAAAATQRLEIARRSRHARKKATVPLAALARLRGDQAQLAQFEKELATPGDDPPWPDPLLDETIELRAGRRGRERRVALLEQAHRYADAAQVYLDLIAKEPSADACAGAAINLFRLREYDRAFALARQGIELAPEDAEARFTLAHVLFARAERARDESPEAPQVQEWFREAALQARRAAELRPDHARAYLFWGLALKHLGELEAAVEPLRKGLACQPADLGLQLSLGEVLLELGRTGDAKTHLENARSLAPGDPRPIKALERLKSK